MTGNRYGGKPEEYPKPWKLKYGETNSERRPITISSHVWTVTGPALGANGHHHVTIRESDNYIFIAKDDCWGQPWGCDQLPDFRILVGRKAYHDDFIKKRDVVKWAVSILAEWGVTRQSHIIHWELDEDDPLADITLARQLKLRAERND